MEPDPSLEALDCAMFIKRNLIEFNISEDTQKFLRKDQELYWYLLRSDKLRNMFRIKEYDKVGEWLTRYHRRNEDTGQTDNTRGTTEDLVAGFPRRRPRGNPE